MSGLGFCHVSVPSDAGTDLDARSYRVYTCGALLEGAGDGVPREQGSGPSHPINRGKVNLRALWNISNWRRVITPSRSRRASGRVTRSAANQTNDVHLPEGGEGHARTPCSD